MKKQLDVNVTGVVSVTQTFFPLLKHETGRIINISSVGGKSVSPFMGPYNASKYALEALSDALRMELGLYGIKVVIIEPGPIKSEIWGKFKPIKEGPFRGNGF